MKEIIWKVYAGRAVALRYCKRCGVKTPFASSRLFRVNAQQKSLDVWLVYRCSVCDATWNLTILSRAAPHTIPPKLLHGFHTNDPELALRYALDASLVKRNGAEPQPPEFQICGEDAGQTRPLRIHLRTALPLDIRAEAVLRKGLGLSRKGFDGMLSSGALVCVSGQALKKCKLSGEIIVDVLRNLE